MVGGSHSSNSHEAEYATGTEAIKLMLTYGEIHFECQHITHDEWEEIRAGRECFRHSPTNMACN